MRSKILTILVAVAGWLLMADGRMLADDAPYRIMADADLMARAGLQTTGSVISHRQIPVSPEK